jgi:hypothetical protein
MARRLHRLLVAGAGEGDQRGGGQRGFLNRRRRIFFEVAQQPAACDPRMAARVFPRHQQRQLERVFEAELRQFPRSGQSGDDVAALKCPSEDRVWTALRGRRSSTRGRTGSVESKETGHPFTARACAREPTHWRSRGLVVDSMCRQPRGTALVDPEPRAGSEASDSPSGGLSGFLGSTPRVIGAITGLIAAVSGLLLALNRAGILGNGGGTSTTTTQSNGTTTVANPPPFGPNGQGGGDGDVQVKDDGTLLVTANEPGHPVRILADPESTSTSTTLTARASWVDGERDWSFALVCRFQSSKNFYLLGVIPISRRYNIARYRDGRLTSLSGLRRSDAIRANGDNNVSASCFGSQRTTLTLKVNGERLPAVRDPNGIAYGNVGIRVGSAVGVVTCAISELQLTPPLQTG